MFRGIMDVIWSSCTVSQFYYILLKHGFNNVVIVFQQLVYKNLTLSVLLISNS